MITVLGAGSVGLWITARLARAGAPVTLLVRSPEVAALLRRQGIEATDLATGESWCVRPAVETVDPPAPECRGAGPVLVCTRSSDTETAVATLHRGGPLPTLVSAQNGVENEAVLARYGSRVLGAVVRQTSTRSAVRCVRGAGRGRIVLGRYPRGIDGETRALGARLTGAGFAVGLSPTIRDDKWLKLCVNLMSAPNALVRRSDHAGQAFVETKVRLLEEARAVLRGAGIVARSGDGCDRSLDAEIEYQRASLAAGTSARRLPLFNHVWTALREGRTLEADGFHARLVALGARHRVPTPWNERVLEVLRRAAINGLGPECVAAHELRPASESSRLRS